MIWHGRQEAQLYTQQQDLAEVLPSGLFSCSSKKVWSILLTVKQSFEIEYPARQILFGFSPPFCVCLGVK